jgi:hypothetical protein
MKQADWIMLAAIGAAAFVMLREPARAGATANTFARIKGATWQPPAIDGDSRAFWYEKEPGW